MCGVEVRSETTDLIFVKEEFEKGKKKPTKANNTCLGKKCFWQKGNKGIPKARKQEKSQGLKDNEAKEGWAQAAVTAYFCLQKKNEL